MLSLFRRLMMNDQGATVIEYTLIGSLIAVAAIASMRRSAAKSPTCSEHEQAIN